MFEDIINKKEKQGSWTCAGCGMIWENNVGRCPVCQTLRWKFDLSKKEVGHKDNKCLKILLIQKRS